MLLMTQLTVVCCYLITIVKILDQKVVGEIFKFKKGILNLQKNSFF